MLAGLADRFGSGVGFGSDVCFGFGSGVGSAAGTGPGAPAGTGSDARADGVAATMGSNSLSVSFLAPRRNRRDEAVFPARCLFAGSTAGVFAAAGVGTGSVSA